MGISQLYGLSGSTFFSGIMPLKDALGGKFVFETLLSIIIFSLILIISGFHLNCFISIFYMGPVIPRITFFSYIIFICVSKIAGFSVLIRFLFESVDIDVYSNISLFIYNISCVSMFYGNIMALRQNDLKRLFAYSTIAHAGYIL